jgi:hypothetical protein
VALIWVYAQVSPDGVHPSALELLTKARARGGRGEGVGRGAGGVL